MFLESQIDHSIQKRSVEVICGSMFSGKTEELLRRIKRAKFAKLKIAVFAPLRQHCLQHRAQAINFEKTIRKQNT